MIVKKRTQSDEAREKMRVAHTGVKFSDYQKECLRRGWLKRKAKGLGTAWNKGVKGSHFSPSTEFKTGFKHSEETKEKFRNRTGENGSNWQGGKTLEQVMIRTSEQYKLWRIDVFSRDLFTCQMPGCSGAHDLEAHHIKTFSEYPELRFEVSNGITLCTNCHDKTKTREEDYENLFTEILKVN